MSILLTLKSQTLYDGQSIAAAEFIDSATDSSGRKIAEYAFCDDGAGGGYFTYDGVKQPEGKWFTVSASRLAEIAYVAGLGAGGDTISVEAYDGAQWSASLFDDRDHPPAAADGDRGASRRPGSDGFNASPSRL